jgi:hypothetical protein
MNLGRVWVGVWQHGEGRYITQCSARYCQWRSGGDFVKFLNNGSNEMKTEFCKVEIPSNRWNVYGPHGRAGLWATWQSWIMGHMVEPVYGPHGTAGLWVTWYSWFMGHMVQLVF